ncbi:hypothetical protein AB0K92_11025 [Streptomyces sp. NPDC052687]|uniref:hypothetical protein n=1 Tax=Streptomyces sp. NPDC052687 TaxID=3154759 RepID=UPI003412B8D6
MKSTPVELVALIAVLVLVAVFVAAWLLRRTRRRTVAAADGPPPPGTADVTGLPPAGLLVPEQVLAAAGSTSATIWDALEAAAAPVAVEYHPVGESELAKLRTVPVNAAMQQALTDIVKALDPKSPTLFRVVLPKGAELVKAAGTSGFRGFSRTGGTTAHAVLKPVAAGGAVAAGWPVLAVAGTVLAMDMMAQREQRAHQRRVEAVLGRQEERHYVERIAHQRSADAQLSRAASLILDGHHPRLELALKSADDEFYRAQQFLEKYRGAVDELVDEDGKADFRRLEEALGGETKETGHFVRELHLARAAIAVQRKALVVHAAAVALADPANPYTALRRFVESQVHRLEDADAVATELTERLGQVQLKGRWYDSDKSVSARQELLRAQISPAEVEGDTEIRCVVTSSGRILQVLPPAEDEPAEPAHDE